MYMYCSCVFVLVCLVRVRGDLFSFLKFFGWCAIHMYFHVHWRGVNSLSGVHALIIVFTSIYVHVV